MLIYLDMCCLKRPFDEQVQPRIRLESEAVLALLTLESDEVRFVRSSALVLENSLNPVKERASRVDQWLTATPLWKADAKLLESRTRILMQLGLKNFDSLHVASAEQVAADFFVTCDDRLLSAAKRNADNIHVTIVSVVEIAKELLK